jgi:predicted O-methyltransferase YrrM
MNHYYQTVDGWFDESVRPGFDRLIASLPDDRPSTFVQIGTWVGRGTSYAGVELVNSGKPATLVAVDHFKGSAEIDRDVRLPGVPKSHENFVKNTLPLVEALGDRFRLIVSDSAAAAGYFEDGSVDVVWIDAAHSYELVAKDLDGWTPKVRPGGLIGGDDFDRRCPGVTRAVLERFGQAAVVPGAVWWMVQR